MTKNMHAQQPQDSQGSPSAPAVSAADAHLAAERSHGRGEAQMRPVSLTRNVMPHALGSCEVRFGETRVLCSASIDFGVPGWRTRDHAGWITAEYAMLPCSTGSRSRRERAQRKGRSMEIERLIGRSLRAVCDLQAMGECTVTVDCDVINADGGTRTASVTGAWVALHDALMAFVEARKIPRLPLTSQVVAVSAGMVAGRVLCDLDYQEDSQAEVDMNIVMTGTGDFVEIQGTGEQTPFSRGKLNSLLDVAQPNLEQLLKIQDACVGWSDGQ